MKKTKKLILLVLSIICLLGMSTTAMAGTKVSKVKMKTTYTSGRQSGYVYGTDKSGNEIWRYQLSSQKASQGFHASFAANSKYVFIIDGKDYIRLNKNTGKKVKEKKNILKYNTTVASKAIVADSSNNLYFAGYFGSDIYKVNSKGKIVWSTKLPNKYIWPYQLKLSGSSVKLKFESEWSKSSATLNKKTGKLK